MFHSYKQKAYDNCVKQNDTLNTMLEKKKNEYDQQVNRSETLANDNSTKENEIKLKVHNSAYFLHLHCAG